MAELTIGGSPPVYACRAWVNFNGTGTVSIRASGNVSSITDNGVGDYTVNFTTAMQDANYSVAGVVGDTTQGFNSIVGIGSQANLWVQAAGSLRFQLIAGSSKFDATNVNVVIFR